MLSHRKNSEFIIADCSSGLILGNQSELTDLRNIVEKTGTDLYILNYFSGALLRIQEDAADRLILENEVCRQKLL